MLDCSLECNKWGITCFPGVGGQQFQKIDKSFKNNRLKHVTKPFHGDGLGSFLPSADDDRAPAEVPSVAGSCAALAELYTTSCIEFLSSGAQASVLCMKGALKKPGAGSMWAV